MLKKYVVNINGVSTSRDLIRKSPRYLYNLIYCRIRLDINKLDSTEKKIFEKQKDSQTGFIARET